MMPLDTNPRDPLTDTAPVLPGFELQDKLGEGAFGAVYRARDIKLDRLVAVKSLRPQALAGAPLQASARERFLAEARTLARVRHPNVLAVHAVLDTTPPGSAALVTELIDGITLSEVVDEQGPLSASEAARIGVDICRALAAVHAAGIVHRDVKPLNVMRERGGRIVLLDFGLGVFANAGGPVEATGVVGSPLFMAPEQVLGEAVTPRTDLYALGVVLYFLATGKYPIVSFELRELFRAIAHGDLRPLRDARPDLPAEFVQVVNRALCRDAEKRFASAGEMEQALLATLGATGPTLPPTPSRRRQLRGSLAAAGVLLLLLAAGLAWLFGGRQPESPFETAVFHLASSPAPLVDGARIEGGSRLNLDVRLHHTMHLYVLNEDERGNVYILFPRQDSGPQNPLDARTLHHLPAADESWEASSAGGKELLLIIACARRQELLEEAARRQQLTGGEVSQLLRGFPRVVARPEGQRTAPALVSAYLDDLKAVGGIAPGGGAWLESGVWVEALTLENQ